MSGKYVFVEPFRKTRVWIILAMKNYIAEQCVAESIILKDGTQDRAEIGFAKEKYITYDTYARTTDIISVARTHWNAQCCQIVPFVLFHVSHSMQQGSIVPHAFFYYYIYVIYFFFHSH